ncbi:hypothetical protein BA724_00680 [Domibacillus iocasae]|uniref:Uncharacterized protein n=2 Tax=Domibacillus iocasae TaxID=1714016 RepID=A0A1E7DU46_9BACI|nr:hypothetical protein BA724_00680 [Domibacillus iocasae]
MKVLGISLMILLLLMAFSMGWDVFLSNVDFNTSLKNTTNPFLVMELAELAVFFLILLSVFVSPVRSFYQKRKKANEENNQQHPKNQ